MPYKIEESNGEYCVHKENSDGSAGEKVKCHPTKPEAEAHMRALYAAMEDEKSMLVFGGCEIKALGDGKVGGYLVTFSGPKDPDVVGDFFDGKTDLGIEDGGRLPVYYQHGYDEKLKTRKIGKGTAKYDDVGLWLEAQLELRDDYERTIYQMAESGKLGWSSGAAGHLVERERVGKSYHIKSWPIAEASLTPTPAEPRNTVIPVKSLFITEPEVKTEPPPVAVINPSPIKEKHTMDESELKALMAQLMPSLAQVVEETTKKAVTSMLPEVKAGFNVEVVEDEADRAAKGNPFQSPGEFFKAVKHATLAPYDIDKRLFPSLINGDGTKANGLNEAIPSQGGFLVPQETEAGIRQNMWGTGSLLSRFSASIRPVTGNNMTINVVDETARAAGYRMGGVRGYWLAEAGTKTSSKPTFKQVVLKLKKVCALCYATDENLEDVAYLGSWLTTNVPTELRFMVEDAIINGNGAGMPLGILASPALVSAVRTDASEVDNLDIGRMWAARYAGVNDYIWLINQNVMPQLMNMTIGQMPAYMPPGGLSGAQYGTLLGRPVLETEYNPSLGTLGDIMLISPSQYELIEKSGGVQSASSIHVAFVTDETAFRFTYRVDGQPTWASSVARYKPSTDYVSPFVALAAST